MEYRIFDMHGHAGRFHEKNCSGELIEELCRKENIGGVLLSSLDGLETPGHEPGGVPVHDQLTAARTMADLCRAHPLWFPAAVCQPGHQDADGLRHELRSGVYRALKFHPYMLNLAADDPAYDPFMDLAEEYDLPVVFHSSPGTSDPALIYALARRHPRVRTVLYHINLGGDLQYGIEVLQTACEKKDAQLWCDTSWVPAEYALKAIDALGSDRVLFGSDMPLDGLDHYAFYYPVIEAVEKHIGTHAASRWLWDQNLDFLGVAE